MNKQYTPILARQIRILEFFAILALSFIASVLLQPSSALAAEIVEGFNFGFQMPGTTLSIKTVPERPVVGEPFDVLIRGTATQVCPPLDYQVATPVQPPLERLRVSASMKVCEARPDGTQQCDYKGDCDPADLPLDFQERLTVDDAVWDAIADDTTLELWFFVDFGQAPINANPPVLREKSAIYRRTVDLQRGTHVIPPRLESGFWVSDEQPSEGLLIQQQGDRVVFYNLAYGPERTGSGDPVGTWRYADALLEGDSGNGVSLKVVQPEVSAPDVEFQDIQSSSLVVDDYNHVRAMFDAGPREPGNEIDYTSYRRWNFNRDQVNRPAVMPDFSGDWSLISFDGGNATDRLALTFADGAWLDTDRWIFEVLDQAVELICKVDNLGEGNCRLNGLDPSATLEFDIADFNGNLANANWIDDAGQVSGDAVLLRKPFELPISD
jgi:hypothetical protein